MCITSNSSIYWLLQNDKCSNYSRSLINNLSSNNFGIIYSNNICKYLNLDVSRAISYFISNDFTVSFKFIAKLNLTSKCSFITFDYDGIDFIFLIYDKSRVHWTCFFKALFFSLYIYSQCCYCIVINGKNYVNRCENI